MITPISLLASKVVPMGSEGGLSLPQQMWSLALSLPTPTTVSPLLPSSPCPSLVLQPLVHLPRWTWSTHLSLRLQPPHLC